RRRAMAGGGDSASVRAVKVGQTSSFQRFLYRLAIERFAIEAALDRWIARPMLAAARALGRREDALVAWLSGNQQPAKDKSDAD
nr:hypothetical protein [Deltaproteobacteria bacterium]